MFFSYIRTTIFTNFKQVFFSNISDMDCQIGQDTVEVVVTPATEDTKQDLPLSTETAQLSQRPKEPSLGCNFCASEEVPLDHLTFCTEGHLCCFDCARKTAEGVIKSKQSILICLSDRVCNAEIHESELRRFLSVESFEQWMDLRLEDDLRKTGLQEEEDDENQESPVEPEIGCEVCCSENITKDQLTQCTEGHLCCMTCAKRMAQERIGIKRSTLPCLSEEKCNAFIHESEIRRFLDPVEFKLWLEIQVQDDLRLVNFANMESCPFCKYAFCAVDYIVPQDGHYQCIECFKITCRSCKEIDHRPYQCNQATDHRVNEDMSKALMRICPNPTCGTPMVKFEQYGGCNKIQCTNCGAFMCYVCRKQLYGLSYEHFAGANDSKGKKCPMYDDTALRHVDEVEQARFGAQAPGPSNHYTGGDVYNDYDDYDDDDDDDDLEYL